MTSRRRFAMLRLPDVLSRVLCVCLMPVWALRCEVVLAAASRGGEPEEVFDVMTLESRGIDPRLAAYFSEHARYLPGRRDVTMYVNENRIGTVSVRFDEQGQLCFDKQLMAKAGIVISEKMSAMGSTPVIANDKPQAQRTLAAKPESAKVAGAQRLLSQVVGPVSAWSQRPTALGPAMNEPVIEGGCYDFKALYPQTDVDLRPGKQEVHLIVPHEALQVVTRDYTRFDSGGAAGMFNYDLLSMQTRSSNFKSNYTLLDTEAGFNLADWVVRSRQNMSDQNGVQTRQHLYTYAQRTFLPLNSAVQVGQVEIVSPVFAGASIIGVQMLPDKALNRDAGGGAMIEGIARTSQARVEVKQDGILMYSAIVPIGPFTFQNIPLLRANSNVDVTVYETDGSQHTNSIPAASLRIASLTKTGLSMAGGKVRDIGNSGAEEPAVFTISNDWLVGGQSKIATGGMLAAGYTALGWAGDTLFSRDTSLTVSNVLSHAKKEGKRGIQSSISGRTALSARLNLSGSITHQSDSFRDLLDTIDVQDMYQMQQDPSNPNGIYTWWRRANRDLGRTQYSANLGWTTAHAGTGSLGFVQSKSSSYGWGRSVTASWGKAFGKVSVNASLQHDLTGDAGDAAFVSVSLPLDSKRRLQTRASKSGDSSAQVSATYNEIVNDALNYSVTASQQEKEASTYWSGIVSAIPRYTQVNLGYAQNGSDSTNYNVGVRGGLAFHDQGITASPYPIQDTFGVISVGDEAGIKVHTSSGSVWTDAGGRAVISQIPAYSTSRVEVATATLPRNVDIDNGYKILEVGRGAVSLIKFGVIKVRRALLTVVDQKGVPLPKGASVVGQDQGFITTVVDDGRIFLDDVSQTKLLVNLPDGKQCTLAFELPEEADVNSYFEQSSAVCVAH